MFISFDSDNASSVPLLAVRHAHPKNLLLHCFHCSPQDFAKAGANMYTFHLEAVADPATLSSQSAHEAVAAVAQEIRTAGMKVGVALKPATPVELLFPYLDQGLLDMVSNQ